MSEYNKSILSYAKNNCIKLIVGIYTHKLVLNDICIKDYEKMTKRKNNINSDECVKKYISTHFTNENIIKIGKSKENTKLIPNFKNEKIFFYHKYKDTF